jgi:hypothetical protein
MRLQLDGMGMSSVTFPSLRKAVLCRIEHSPLKPMGLLKELGTNYTYTEIQDALSYLIEMGDVTLTPELVLVLSRAGEDHKEG